MASSPERDVYPLGAEAVDSDTAWNREEQTQWSRLRPGRAGNSLLASRIVNSLAVDDRAETYLRLLAEAELRRAGNQLRRLDAAAEIAAEIDAGSDPDMSPFACSER